MYQALSGDVGINKTQQKKLLRKLRAEFDPFQTSILVTGSHDGARILLPA